MPNPVPPAARTSLARASTHLALAAVVGVLAGVSSAAFLVALDHVTDLRLTHGWLVWFLPAGGLALGLVSHHLGGRSGAGTALILDEIHEPTAWVPRRMAPLVLGGTLVTHLFGGSAGREGTAIQMSGSLTDALGRAVRVDAEDRRVLLVAAMAGGFGAVFGVPFAGWVFGLEVSAAWPRRHVRAVVPALVAPLVGDRVVDLLGVRHTPLPPIRGLHLDLRLLVQLAVAGVAFGLVASIFHGATQLVRRTAARLLRWPPARPLAGGIVVVLLVASTGSRQHLGLSLPLMAGAVAGGAGIASGAFAGKLAFTAITLGTGFPGGEVTPLFVIGSTLGMAVARLVGAPVGLLASVGLVAVFGAAANAPLACTVMAVELFGWGAVVPAAIGCVIARFASTRHSIYGSRGRPASIVGRKDAVSNADDSQFVAEEIDPEELPGEGDRLVGEGGPEEYPPTHLSGVNAYGITAAEERIDEPIDERETREVRDDLAAELDEDRTLDERAWDDPELGGPVGRLVEPGADDDGLDEPDEEADAVASELDADELTPEESAMHVTADPPDGEPHDGYY